MFTGGRCPSTHFIFARILVLAGTASRYSISTRLKRVGHTAHPWMPHLLEAPSSSGVAAAPPGSGQAGKRAKEMRARAKHSREMEARHVLSSRVRQRRRRKGAKPEAAAAAAEVAAVAAAAKVAEAAEARRKNARGGGAND